MTVRECRKRIPTENDELGSAAKEDSKALTSNAKKTQNKEQNFRALHLKSLPYLLDYKHRIIR